MKNVLVVVLVLLLGCGGSKKMTVFLSDTFTASNGTSLTARTGEIGATWTQHPNFAQAATIQSNAARGSANNAIFYASISPTSPDYYVEADIVTISNTSSDTGVLCRMSTTLSQWYSATITTNSGGFGVRLFKSASSQLGSSVTIPQNNGDVFRLRLTVAGTSTTTIDVSVQRLSDSQWLNSSGSFQAGQTNCISVSDSSSPVTTPGRAGIWLNNAGRSITEVTAVGQVGDVVSGTASTTSVGSTIATVACTAAAGGVGSYTYQWQRSTTSGSGFSNVSGATSLTFNDTGLTNGTTYYYRCVATDAASSTATSNETSATPVFANDFTVDDASIFFSPYNWRVSGSSFAETVNPGSYLKTKFSGASCALLLDTTNQSALSSGNYPAIAWSVNGGAWTRSQITSGQTTLSLASGLGSGPHTLELVVVGGWWNTDRWNTPVSALRITGLRLAASATLSSPTLRTGRAIVFADSNGEGYEALAVGVSVANQDAGQAFPLLLGLALDCEVGVVAFAGQGYNDTGGGNVPDLEDAWDFYSSGRSRLIDGLLSPMPDYLISTHGQNDASDPQTAVESCVSQWLSATSDTKIAICSPINLNQVSGIEAAVTATASSRVKFVTTGQNYLIAGTIGANQWSNTNHLSVRGQANFAAALAGAIKSSFESANATTWKNLSKKYAVDAGYEVVE